MTKPHKTLAWPTSLLYAALIVYASWYPFSGLEYLGLKPWDFLHQPFNWHWTWFDVLTNVLGYMPLGFLWALSLLRNKRRGTHASVIWAWVAASLVSLVMELGQTYIETRVPSNIDLLLNASGAGVGVLLATLLERMGAIGQWQNFRSRWLQPDARPELTLVLMWFVALLYPSAVPFATGQVFLRLNEFLLEVFALQPQVIAWLDTVSPVTRNLSLGAQAFCAYAGLLTPLLLLMSAVRSVPRRVAAVIVTVCASLGLLALSTSLIYGPSYALAWANKASVLAIVFATATALWAAFWQRRTHGVLVLLLLPFMLQLLNRAPINPYFAQTLGMWEQGRFMRFQGLAMWMALWWPFAALIMTALKMTAAKPALDTKA